MEGYVAKKSLSSWGENTLAMLVKFRAVLSSMNGSARRQAREVPEERVEEHDVLETMVL